MKYLFTGFSGPKGKGESLEELHVFTSDDGVKFDLLPAVYHPPRGTVRDPSPIWHDGRWLVVYTTIGFTQGCYFGVAESQDLLNWRMVTHVDMSRIEGISVVWAPEWFVDDDGLHVLCTVSCDGGCTLSGSTFEMYEMHPTTDDLREWSPPVPLDAADGFCAAAIDPFVVKSGDEYHLWYKDDQWGSVELAVAPSLLGPYTSVRTGNWAGWQDCGANLEGPCPVYITDTHWRLYADIFLNHYEYHGTHYSDSFDGGDTWTPLAPTESPVLMRHGTVRKIA